MTGEIQYNPADTSGREIPYNPADTGLQGPIRDYYDTGFAQQW